MLSETLKKLGAEEDEALHLLHEEIGRFIARPRIPDETSTGLVRVHLSDLVRLQTAYVDWTTARLNFDEEREIEERQERDAGY